MSCNEIAALTLEAYGGPVTIPLAPGGMTDPDGFTGYGADTIQSGNDGEYYVWFGCRMSGIFPETLLVWRQWVGGVMVDESTSSSQKCPTDPSLSQPPPDGEAWDSVSPFDTGATFSDGWGVREV